MVSDLETKAIEQVSIAALEITTDSRLSQKSLVKFLRRLVILQTSLMAQLFIQGRLRLKTGRWQNHVLPQLNHF